jgi:hypothetical protein
VAGTDTGPFLLEAKAFEHWGFSFFGTGTITGGQVSILGTYDEDTAGILAFFNPTPGYVPQTLPSASRWFPLVAKSTQTEQDALIENPITVFDGTHQMIYDGPLFAVRLVANAYTGGGSIRVDVLAIE